MISDILSDALAEIERYQTDPVFAPAYADPEIRARIETVKAAMRELQGILDTPPVYGAPGITVTPVCHQCAGSEVCPTCDGHGGTLEDATPACPSANATWTPCAGCAGTGTCPECAAADPEQNLAFASFHS